MPIRVLIEQQVLPGEERKALGLVRRLRASCLEEPGYITSELFHDADDERRHVLITTWFGRGDWERWSESAAFRELTAQLRPLLAEPPRVQVLLEGAEGQHIDE